MGTLLQIGMDILMGRHNKKRFKHQRNREQEEARRQEWERRVEEYQKQLAADLDRYGATHLIIEKPPKAEKEQPPIAPVTRTSITDPIRVDWVPGLGLTGNIGATICPGKTQKGGRQGSWERSLSVDLARLVTEYKTHTLVSLMEPDEFQELGVAQMHGLASYLGIRCLWYPVVDGSTPRQPNLFRWFSKTVLQTAVEGKNVVVHCRGGIGRSGTLLACALVTGGMSPGAAILKVREARPNAVENPGQIRYVFQFRDALEESAKGSAPPASTPSQPTA